MISFLARKSYEHNHLDHMPNRAETGDLARCECGRWFYYDVDLFGCWWPAKRHHRRAIRAAGGVA